MDVQLRTHERRWRRGDPPEGPVYLRYLQRAQAPEREVLSVRVSVGDLPQERLDLAAFLGHAPAAEAIGVTVTTPLDVMAWVSSLARWGKEVTARAATAAASAALPAFERRRPRDPRARAVVQAADRFLARAAPVTTLREAVWDATFTGPFMPVAYNLGACALATDNDALGADEVARFAAEAADAAEALVGDLAIVIAIRRALIPWALG